MPRPGRQTHEGFSRTGIVGTPRRERETLFLVMSLSLHVHVLYRGCLGPDARVDPFWTPANAAYIEMRLRSQISDLTGGSRCPSPPFFFWVRAHEMLGEYLLNEVDISSV